MADRDLLRFIEERLSQRHQVVFTTHSPFMVSPDKLERVRLLEDHDREGAKVWDNALGSQDETQLPIRAAIGVERRHGVCAGAPVESHP